jgi:phosphoribosylglycinamide formyltransferase-1
MNLGFLASHHGTTMQAVLDACRTGRLGAKPCVVISNNRDAEALARAARHGIAHYHLSAATHPDPAALDAAIVDVLARHDVELVVLAGYMKKLGPAALARYRRRILNTHPALLPRFGGQGMYGLRVHEAVLAAGERETGVTIHVVDADYDTGPIVAQCRVPVRPDDTPASLAERVQARERDYLVEILDRVVRNELTLP